MLDCALVRMYSIFKVAYQQYTYMYLKSVNEGHDIIGCIKVNK